MIDPRTKFILKKSSLVLGLDFRRHVTGNKLMKIFWPYNLSFYSGTSRNWHPLGDLATVLSF